MMKTSLHQAHENRTTIFTSRTSQSRRTSRASIALRASHVNIFNKIALGAGTAFLSAALLVGATALAASSPATAYAETAEEAQAAATQAYNQLLELQNTQSLKQSEYIQCLNDYQTAIGDRDDAQNQINEIQDKISEVQGNLGNRARTMYRDGAVSLLDVFFGSASFEDFTQNLNVLDRINQNDAKNIQKSKDLKEEAEQQHARLEEAANQAEQKANDASSAYAESKAAAESMQTTYDNLSEQAKVLCQQEAEAAAAASAAASAVASTTSEPSSEAMAQAAEEFGVTYNSDGSITDTSTGTTYASASAYSAATGNSIVDRARAMIGSSYVWGGTGADGTFDCSGLVGYAITGDTTRIGNTTTYMGWNQVSPSVGSIVVNNGHTGVVSGVNSDGSITVIHAQDESTGVVESTWSSDYYNSRGYIFVEP